MKVVLTMFAFFALIMLARTPVAAAKDLSKKKVVVIAFEESGQEESNDPNDYLSEEEQSAQARHDARMRNTEDSPAFEELVKEL